MQECCSTSVRPTHGIHRGFEQGAQELASIYFTEKCETCGRPLRMLLSLLGQRVTCPHCAAPFVAGGHDSEDGSTPRRSNLAHAAQLLAERKPASPRATENAPPTMSEAPHLWAAPRIRRGGAADTGSLAPKSFAGEP